MKRKAGTGTASAGTAGASPAGAGPAGADPAGTAPVGDWRDTLRRAADLALLGVVTAVASAPLVTAGAAAAAASSAVHHWCDHDGWPRPAELWRVFTRALVPGAGAVLALGACGALLAANAAAIASGLVPGGTAGLLLTAIVAALGLGLALLTVAEVGALGGRHWRAALAGAVTMARASVMALAAASASAAVVVALAWFLPQVAPVLPGYALFAAHALRRRWHGGPPARR